MADKKTKHSRICRAIEFRAVHPHSDERYKKRNQTLSKIPQNYDQSK
jgi:hypothetical protein